MAVEGRLSEIGLSDLLDLFAAARCTGTVELSNGGEHGEIALHQGAVVRASLNGSETVGEALTRAGKIALPELEQALEIQQQGAHQKLLLGTILVNCGAIGKAELETFIRDRICAAVRQMCYWESGAFCFRAEPESAEAGEFPERVEVAELLAEVAHTTQDAQKLEQWLPDDSTVIRPAPDLAQWRQPLRLSRDEWAVFWLVGRGRRVGDIVSQAVNLERHVGIAALRSLLAAGVLVSEERDASRFRLIDNGLRELVRGSRARCCMLVSSEGHPLYEHRTRGERNGTNISALAAGALMCIESISGDVEADRGYAVVEGRRALMYLARVAPSAILVIICDGGGQLGHARLLARDFAASYGPLLEALLPPVILPSGQS